MENPTISVIVPAYNVESYLCRCIDSILAQDFTDFELLLIDDGSTDASGKICDEYAAKDDRITVFHQPNSGVSAARNKGLSESKGVWIQFVDSDDWIEPHAFRILMDLVDDEIDLVLSDIYINTDNRQTLVRQNAGDDLLQAVLDKKVRGWLWNKFFRRSLITDSGISFNHELTFCEDEVFWMELCLSRKLRMVHSSMPVNHYYCRKNSITYYPEDKECYVGYVEKYINVLATILKGTHYDYRKLVFCVKYNTKWLLLRWKCNWNDYKQTFPEIFHEFEMIPKPGLRLKLIKMTNNKVGFLAVRFVARFIFSNNFLQIYAFLRRLLRV